MSTDEPRLDERKLAELAAITTRHGSLLARVSATWLKECPRLLREAEAALAAGDAEALELAAHTCRSGCEHVGARRLAAVARRLEQLAQGDGDWSLGESMMGMALAEFAAVRELLILGYGDPAQG